MSQPLKIKKKKKSEGVNNRAKKEVKVKSRLRTIKTTLMEEVERNQ
jgi:hypothetical protein